MLRVCEIQVTVTTNTPFAPTSQFSLTSLHPSSYELLLTGHFSWYVCLRNSTTVRAPGIDFLWVCFAAVVSEMLCAFPAGLLSEVVCRRLIGANNSGRAPRNELRRELFNAVGMPKSARGTFMPCVNTLLDALRLLGAAGVLRKWDTTLPSVVRPSPSGDDELASIAWVKFGERAKAWLLSHGKTHPRIPDAEVKPLCTLLRSGGSFDSGSSCDRALSPVEGEGASVPLGVVLEDVLSETGRSWDTLACFDVWEWLPGSDLPLGPLLDNQEGQEGDPSHVRVGALLCLPCSLFPSSQAVCQTMTFIGCVFFCDARAGF